MDKLTDEARRAISEIKDGKFQPQKDAAQGGTYRLFAALPQPHFTTRYMPIDTTVLHGLMAFCWRQHKHPDDIHRGVSLKKFKTEAAEWWSRVFRLERLGGIKVPGMSTQEGKHQRSTPRRFGFLMMTDGVGCSFHCRRPGRKKAAASPYTPQTAPYKPDKTVFKAIDPGVNAIWTWVTLMLTWGLAGGDEMDVDGRGR
jgi:hypothetical protein